jgi:dTDP-4-amino-4,6-dideoxygalactose transaminase
LGAEVDQHRAWEVVERFERALCEYTGAKYAVATDSATNALFLCFKRRIAKWQGGTAYHLSAARLPPAPLPRRTYVGVARAALNAGLGIEWTDEEWIGEYSIGRIVDAARWLRRDMYGAGTWTCLSFHAFKHLPIGRGGAILCDDEDDAEWFRRARYDGRDQTKPIMEQESFQFGIHCYLEPEKAARGLLLMNNLADVNEPLPGTYPDLSKVTFA